MIKLLQRLQKRAASIIAHKPYDYSATSILKELGWPSIKDFVYKETIIMAFKSLKYDLRPSYLNDLCQNLSQVHCRDLRLTSMFHGG